MTVIHILKAPYTCSFLHQLGISGKHSSHAAITHGYCSFIFPPPSIAIYSFTQVSGLRRRATCENENAQTSKQYQMEDSNPGCLDCEIVSQNERTKLLTDQRHSLHHRPQWRIQSWSQGGFPKVANLSGW